LNQLKIEYVRSCGYHNSKQARHKEAESLRVTQPELLDMNFNPQALLLSDKKVDTRLYHFQAIILEYPNALPGDLL